MSHQTSNAPDALCFRFKSSQLPLTELELTDFDPDRFSQQLSHQAETMPQLFQQMPIVLNLDKLPAHLPAPDLKQLAQLCRAAGLNPIGARGDQRLTERDCSAAELAHFRTARTQKREQPETLPPQPSPSPSAKVITHPVRSGQQVYARGGDLIVLSAVSAGAEVMADGNIHVYGPLRGRAMAGVNGQQQARIFCQSLEAELISIAGYFKACDDLQSSLWKQPAQAYLSGTRLETSAL